MSETETATDPAIVLFDGVCNLCSSAVQFIIKNDPKRRFRFAALQSPVGRTLLARHGLPTETLSSLVLVENGHAFVRSTAALRIARLLRTPWPLAFVFIVMPRFLRDLCYDLVAKNRYRLFGKHDSCMMPTPDLNARFLTDGNVLP